MSRPVLALALAALSGCTTVRVAQREQCWVRQTIEVWQTQEELGPCQRAAPQWSADRPTRLVQECVAEADHRWLNQALSSWSRGEAMPSRPGEDELLSQCLRQASGSMLAEVERLEKRLEESSAEKRALADEAQRDRVHLRRTLGQLAADLGESARRPIPPATATATATSEGRSSSAGRSASEQTPARSVFVAAPLGVQTGSPPPRQPLAPAKPAAMTPVSAPAGACGCASETSTEKPTVPDRRLEATPTLGPPRPPEPGLGGSGTAEPASR